MKSARRAESEERPHLGIEAMRYVGNIPDVSQAARLVFLVLCRYSNKWGGSWPSLTLLSYETKHSPRHIRRAVQELARVGALTVEYRLGHSTRFFLDMDTLRAFPDERPKPTRDRLSPIPE